MKNLFLTLWGTILIIWGIILISVLLACGSDYSRSKFKHWVDEDHDGQDTRQEVLVEESLVPVIFDEDGKVSNGLWLCKYTGRVFKNPGELDLDHLVPLKEAWDSGANNWDSVSRERYANYLKDPKHLILVWKYANRSKGAKDPSKWMPPNRSYWQEYLVDWRWIKLEWGLKEDEEERNMIDRLNKIAGKYRIGDTKFKEKLK